MNGEIMALWAGVIVTLLVSIAAWTQSRSAQKDTRAYKDAVFVVEWEPFEIINGDNSSNSQGQLSMKLINQGETFARDVRMVADFDPFGMVIPHGTWDYIAGHGAAVTHWTAANYTYYGVERMPAFRTDGTNLEVAARGAELVTVKFTSQTGHKRTQKVPMPNPYIFAKVLDQPAPDTAAGS